MQTLDDIDAQSACEQILNLDDHILYSGFLNTQGSVIGEAIKDSISAYDRLSVMVLPAHPRNSSLILATISSSNLSAIVEKTKGFLGSRSSITLFVK